jgi:shikimate kinase
VRTIALIGLRCVGKSSVGRQLAVARNVSFLDLDEQIVVLAGSAGGAGDVLGALGEARFRELEHEALVAALAEPRELVLATGGGVVERADNRALLRARTLCVWLRNDVAVLQSRLAQDPSPRPALLGLDAVSELPALALRRERLYRDTAHGVVECGADAPAAIAARIADLIDAGPEA